MLTRFIFKNRHFKNFIKNDNKTSINTLLFYESFGKNLLISKNAFLNKNFSTSSSFTKISKSSINHIDTLYDEEKVKLLAPHDINQAIILLHNYLNSDNCYSIEKIVSIMKYISDNLYQLEFGKEDKINKILYYFFLIFQKFNLNGIESIILMDNSVQKILSKIISPKMMEYYTPESCLYALLIINTLNSLNNGKSKFDEIKFLIQYGLSPQGKIYKFLKYGKYIFKETFKTKEKILYRIFINLSTLDNSNLPIKFEIKKESLPYLIFAQYLELKNNNFKNIDDYVKLLEEYMKVLESEYNNSRDYNNVDFIPTDIYSKLKIFETVINVLNHKKEYPLIKLISDILISYFRQYRENLNINQMMILMSIFSHDNFMNLYDIELFKEDFTNHLFKIFQDKDEISLKEMSLLPCIDLVYSLDKIYSSDKNKPRELIEILIQVVSKYDKEYSELIKINFFNKEDLLSQNYNGLVDEREKFYMSLYNQIIKSYPTTLELIKQIENSNNLVEKYKLILYLKFIILYTKNSNHENIGLEFLKKIK
jgi:hypothetical protein